MALALSHFAACSGLMSKQTIYWVHTPRHARRHTHACTPCWSVGKQLFERLKKSCVFWIRARVELICAAMRILYNAPLSSTVGKIALLFYAGGIPDNMVFQLFILNYFQCAVGMLLEIWGWTTFSSRGITKPYLGRSSEIKLPIVRLICYIVSEAV